MCSMLDDHDLTKRKYNATRKFTSIYLFNPFVRSYASIVLCDSDS